MRKNTLNEQYWLNLFTSSKAILLAPAGAAIVRRSFVGLESALIAALSSFRSLSYKFHLLEEHTKYSLACLMEHLLDRAKRDTPSQYQCLHNITHNINREIPSKL